MSEKGRNLVGVSNYPKWLTFSKNAVNNQDLPKVVSYISFFNCGSIFYLINIYSDSLQSALKYLKNTEANINNILFITGNFNIRDSIWNPNFPHHSIHSNLLIDIADFINLYLLSFTN